MALTLHHEVHNLACLQPHLLACPQPQSTHCSGSDAFALLQSPISTALDVADDSVLKM